MEAIDLTLDITDYSRKSEKRYRVALDSIRESTGDPSYDAREGIGDKSDYWSGEILRLEDGTLLYVQNIYAMKKAEIPAFKIAEHIAKTAYVPTISQDELIAMCMYNNGYISHRYVAEHNPDRPTKEHLKEALHYLFKDMLIQEDTLKLTDPLSEKDYAKILRKYDPKAKWKDIEQDGWRLKASNDGRDIVKWDMDFSEFLVKPEWAIGGCNYTRSHVLNDISIVNKFTNNKFPNQIRHPDAYIGYLIADDNHPVVYFDGYQKFLEKYYGLNGQTCTTGDLLELMQKAHTVDIDMMDCGGKKREKGLVTELGTKQKATGERFADIVNIAPFITDAPLPVSFANDLLDKYVRPGFEYLSPEERAVLSNIEDRKEKHKVKNSIYEEKEQQYKNVKKSILKLFYPTRNDQTYNSSIHYGLKFI